MRTSISIRQELLRAESAFVKKTKCWRLNVQDLWRYPDLLFHDFRRSGIRNLKRSGVTDSVAMRISGHKTRAVYDRYDIVDEDDLSDAAAKVKAFRDAQNHDTDRDSSHGTQKQLDSDLNSDNNRDSATNEGLKSSPSR